MDTTVTQETVAEHKVSRPTQAVLAIIYFYCGLTYNFIFYHCETKRKNQHHTQTEN